MAYDYEAFKKGFSNILEFRKINYKEKSLFAIVFGEAENQNEITIPFDDTFNQIIYCIEWLIKEGYFNKEYLV